MNCRGCSDISKLLHFFPSPGVATECRSQLTLFWVSALADFCWLGFLAWDVRLEFSVVFFPPLHPFLSSLVVGNRRAAAAAL